MLKYLDLGKLMEDYYAEAAENQQSISNNFAN
jgi:hypothetical protein